MTDPLFLDAEALEAAAKLVGSTDVATVAVTAYLNALADKFDDKNAIRELGPLKFDTPPPPPPPENQPQLDGVDWEDYEDS
jgi:hypothetical protein